MAPNGKDKDKQTNPFEYLQSLGDMGDIRKFLGPDFFKNLPLPNMKSGSFMDDSDTADEDEFPRIDLYNRGTHEMIAVMELAGLASASDVSLSVRGNSLTVRGRISTLFNLKDDAIILSECHHGPFERKIELPANVLNNKAEAFYRNGLLVVRMEKDISHSEPDDFVSIDFSSP